MASTMTQPVLTPAFILSTIVPAILKGSRFTADGSVNHNHTYHALFAKSGGTTISFGYHELDTEFVITKNYGTVHRGNDAEAALRFFMDLL